jgi:hypothetical protein
VRNIFIGKWLTICPSTFPVCNNAKSQTVDLKMKESEKYLAKFVRGMEAAMPRREYLGVYLHFGGRAENGTGEPHNKIFRWD